MRLQACNLFRYLNVLRGILYTYIGATNDLVEVEVDVDTSIVQCRFLGGFTGTAQCQIEYSTQEDLSGSFEDTGSSTSGDTVTVTLTTSLEERTTYYYRVTATAEGVSVRVEGRTGMLKQCSLVCYSLY